MIEETLKTLKEGGIVCIPTETSYGLACDPFNEKAVKKLHEIKKEPTNKPVLLLVANKQMIEEIVEMNEKLEKLIEKFLPGPLTIIAKKKKRIPDFIAKEKVAFRISGHKDARELSKKFGKPITGTSANLHGEKPAYSVEKVKEYFPGIEVIDAGTLEEKEASTIFDLEEMKVIREGPIAEEEILKTLE
ncbi:threonylcarbamoyl-AMP synthase [archaeon]|nr:threonylcarbamoyl-AMP synthase [archaeon]